jgi:hypothetical protein
MELTVEAFRRSDWGEDLNVFVQPAEWPVSKDSAAKNYKRVLEDAVASGCDFALILEDDARVCRHLRHNLSSIPIVRRDQVDFFSLYVPDLIAEPWKRQETHLGYRLARPLYSGPNRLWAKHRLWGSQTYLLSRRLLLTALEQWDGLTRGLDTRVITVCSRLKLPMWYAAPCLTDHAPLRSAHATPTAHAPDFDPDFRLTIGAGFQPPEEVPGWLTVEEGRLLWETSAGRAVLELGTGWGRATVCLAQQARSVVSVERQDTPEAAEWVRRYEVADRVEFRRVAPDLAPERRGERFDLVLVDTEHHAAAVARDILTALRVLTPGGLIAFHDYPDPSWPDVRKVVDEHASRLGWRRVAQAGYLGVFAI